VRLFAESFSVSSGEGVNRYELQIYTQPLLLYLAAQAYEEWSRLTWRGFRVIERPMRRAHRRRCAGKCGVLYSRTSVEHEACVWIPFTVRQDLRAHELGNRRRQELAHVPLDAAVAAKLGWDDALR
jgi:hypothetical protein